MAISFLNGHPALLIKGEQALVISDLHIGLEFKFNSSGIYFPKAAKKMAGKILAIYKDSGAKELIILGDVKERILNVTREDEDSLRTFFTELRHIPISIAKGNHDAYLDRILKNLGFDIKIEREILLKNAALLHGNAAPSEDAMKKEYIIIGHGHAAANVNGEDEKVWIVAKRSRAGNTAYKEINKNAKLVIVPAFNDLITGTRINKQTKEHIPLLRNELFDIKKAKVYDIKGNLLGNAEVLG